MSDDGRTCDEILTQMNNEMECTHTEYLYNIKNMIKTLVSADCTRYMEKVFQFFENMEEKPSASAGSAIEVASEYLKSRGVVKMTRASFEEIDNMVTEILCRKMQTYLELYSGNMETVIQFSRECQQVFHEAKEKTKDHLKMSLMLSIRNNDWPMKFLEAFDWPIKNF